MLVDQVCARNVSTGYGPVVDVGVGVGVAESEGSGVGVGVGVGLALPDGDGVLSSSDAAAIWSTGGRIKT
jgi:hypothetical protein